MKIKTLLPLAATTVLSFHLTLAQDAKPPMEKEATPAVSEKTPAGKGKTEEDTPLAKEMSAMNKSYKLLKKQAADPAKKEDNLKLIESIKKNAEAAVPLEPAKKSEVPEAEKATFVEKYKKAATDLKAAFEALETAVKSDDAAAVKAAFAKIDQQKKDGHREFQSEK